MWEPSSTEWLRCQQVFEIDQRLGGTYYLYLRGRILCIISANTSWEQIYSPTLHKGLRITCTNPTQSYIKIIYDPCLGSIQPFWISREPVAWPWCNLAASQRRPYCASANSHSPVGLVSRQWDVVDWDCVVCDRRIHKRADQLHHDNAPAHCTALVQAFLAKHRITQVCQPPYSPDFPPCDLWLFQTLKLPLKGWRFVNATVTQYTSSVNGVSLPTD